VKKKNIIKDTINKILFLLRWTIDPIVNEYINLNMSHTYVDSKEFKNRAKQFEINETSQTKKMLRRVSQALDDIFYKSI
jgi:hypothetical protein